MKRIYALPPSLANQIAAGEVIERPASVVKELLENALDAEAHRIRINIEAGGVRLIEVIDDGMGIHPDDLPLAVMPHATSKIYTLEDLFSVQSLGFRGEALASIASVSRFSLISHSNTSESAYELTFEDIQKNIKIQPIAHAQGTTVRVCDLFYNTPVRRKFLSSEKTEWMQIEQVVKRIVLSRFDVDFQLKYKTLSHWPSVNNEAGMHSRVKKIFGSAFLEKSEKISVESDSLRLWGWVGLPSLMRSQNDLQYVYLNGRMVRDKVIQHAIRAAYEGHLYPGRQPVFLLYLEMPPEQVDVNVHPTKHEVRFREPRQIHDLITSQISKVLSGCLVSPIFCMQDQIHENQIKEQPAIYYSQQEDNCLFQRERMPEGRVRENLFNISKPSNTSSMDVIWLDFPYCFIKYQNAFWLCDYDRLYQYFCRECFLKDYSEKKLITRPLLVPVRLKLSSAIIIDKIMQDLKRLESFALSLSQFDEQTLIIRAFPAVLPHLDLQEWIKNWVICIEENNHSDDALTQTLVKANKTIFPADSYQLNHVLEWLKNNFDQNRLDKNIIRKAEWKNWLNE